MGMVSSNLYRYCGFVCVESEVAVRETQKTIGSVRNRLCQTYVSNSHISHKKKPNTTHKINRGGRIGCDSLHKSVLLKDFGGCFKAG